MYTHPIENQQAKNIITLKMSKNVYTSFCISTGDNKRRKNLV